MSIEVEPLPLTTGLISTSVKFITQSSDTASKIIYDSSQAFSTLLIRS
jgi:hypothetical protein